MNDEEINRAIAEHLGWKWFDHPDTRERTKTFTLSDKWVLNPAGKLVFPHSVPNYSCDLNAMHEAVQRLNEVELFRFADEVCDLVYDGHHDTDIPKLLNLSAKELAGCYVRAIGKWSGEEAKP